MTVICNHCWSIISSLGSCPFCELVALGLLQDPKLTRQMKRLKRREAKKEAKKIHKTQIDASRILADLESETWP